LNALDLKILSPRTSLVPMTKTGDEFSALVPGVAAGTDYVFVTEGGNEYPDPVSRSQPHGVHGSSRVVDQGFFAWSDADWTGISTRDLVVYELHTGTFSAEGTFEAIVHFLPYLRKLGITAIELMPVAEFPGTRNWGYDGVSLYAPHSAYGGPDGLKALVDACHRVGLAVILDVVYNHLGPEGNYLGVFAPYFTNVYRTPWGEAINFDGPYSDGVRRFFIDNALYWVTEYHIDALRLDAVHGIFDFGAWHILEELTDAVHRQGVLLGRSVTVIAESDLNDVRLIRPRSACGYGLDAQWLDEFHHSLRAVLTRSNQGYLADFGKMSDLSKAITEGFVHDGNYSPYRRRRYGSPSVEIPGRQFVAFIQNHDQVANASQGDRLATLLTLDQQKLAAMVVLCAPFIPLLFMGQEYGETAPFHFFTSFDDPKLIEAVRAGRRAEFADFAQGRDFADPQDPATFQHSKLNWSLSTQTPHSGILRLYQDLLALRKRWPCLGNCRKDLVRTDFSEQRRWLVMERTDPVGPHALLVCNFGGSVHDIPISAGAREWRLEIWSAASAYGSPESFAAPPKLLGPQSSSVALADSQAALYLSLT
jgi:maltooligosyltrehalose trehalohydrolase